MTDFELSGKLLTRNALLNLAGQAGPMLVALAAIPFLIKGLGVERFGLLSIAWLATEYFMFIDLGLGRATIKHAAEALGRGNQERLVRVAWTAVTIQVGLGLLAALALISIEPYLTARVLNIPFPLAAEAAAIFQLVALSIPLVLVSGSLSGILAAAQRFDMLNAVNATFNASVPGLAVIGVVGFDWRLAEIGAMLVVCRLISLLVQYRLCLRLFPLLNKPRFHSSELRALLTFGGWVTVSGLAVPILLYLDRFVIGSLLSMAAAAYYSIPYDIVTRLWIIPASLGATLFPAFATLTGQGQPERFADILARSMKWMLLSLGLAVVMITAFAGDILRIWLGAEFAQESAVALQILALGILVNSMVHVQYAMIQGLGRPDVTAKIHLLQVPLHVILVWWLVDLWGINGAALAQSVRLGAEALLVLLAACRLASLPLSSLISDRVVQSSLLLFLFVGMAMAISHLPWATWVRILGSGIVVMAGAATVWGYSFDRYDRQRVASLFRTVEAQ